jgi:16S rRNA (cytosine1402-N4)-methyltransferase
MVQEVCRLLQPRPGDTILDLNVGTGGHSLALLEACGGEGFLVGLDLDDAMLTLARDRLRSSSISSQRYALVQANHALLGQALGSLGLGCVDRILMDLGAASPHFDDPDRGFSCTLDGPLDMRYDRTKGPTAAEIVNTWSRGDLGRLFREKGDELWSGRIADRLVRRRAERPFERTIDLADEVAAAIPRRAWPPKIHPATRVFLALRVEVNAEEESLRQGLEAALEVLAPGGRLAVLTFQSHEDAIVKERFRRACRDEIDESDPWGRVKNAAAFRDLTRRPLRPSEEEMESNPRSRSTKLRAVEKLKITD